jgi:AraC family transcriptional regulator
LVIAICEEKSTTTLSAGLPAIFCCILGESVISTGTDEKFLQRGDIHICDAQSPHEIAVASHSACLVIAGSAQAWIAHSRRFASSPRPMPVPVAATYRKSTTACSNLLRLARRCRADGRFVASDPHARSLLNHVDELQAELASRIARCPGSSLARKRAVFMRLHRARNLIETCANDDLDISKLALAANYSVGHFITIFGTVFGETPYASINRHRLSNVRSLLRASDLAVGDIAQSSGFSSPSSFTRAMKKHTGKSATEFRMALRNPA